MTNESIQAALSDLSEGELIAAFNIAKNDLAEAAADQPNSDWHQACFAGVLAYAMELQRRGIVTTTVH